MRSIGWLFIIAGVLSCVLLGNNSFLFYVDVPFAFFVLCVVTGGLWVAYGPSRAFGAIRRSLTGTVAPDAQRDVRVLQLGYRLSWGAGLISMVFFLVGMLSNIADPDAFVISVGYSMLPVLYGAVLAELVFSPLEHALNDRIAEQNRCGETADLQRSSMGAIASSVIFFLLAMCFLGLLNTPEVVKLRAIHDSPIFIQPEELDGGK